MVAFGLIMIFQYLALEIARISIFIYLLVTNDGVVFTQAFCYSILVFCVVHVCFMAPLGYKLYKLVANVVTFEKKREKLKKKITVAVQGIVINCCICTVICVLFSLLEDTYIIILTLNITTPIGCLNMLVLMI